MKYVYPAIFTPLDEGGFDVSVPDLPGCRTCADSLAEVIEMAEDAISLWLWDTEEEKRPIPPASDTLQHSPPQFINYIKADTEAYRRQMDNRAVKKTLTIPAWLNHMAESAHVNFSGVLQEALKQHLHITD
ncbi:MAG: type II toxin-antitoxin system HicB family antitoxin [Oscillospiraceae bacterium]|jgi:predicted RNase H-like HicB family nuclease|nr:type II toxin-antitoxin system HicB family antitoxin [Oscillospiraceae bacterium]